MSPISFEPQVNRVLENVSRELVGMRSKLEAADLHIEELRKHNIELQAKLERYELKEHRLKKLQNTESYCEMVHKVSEYQLSDKDFVMVYVKGEFHFSEIAGGTR